MNLAQQDARAKQRFPIGSEVRIRGANSYRYGMVIEYVETEEYGGRPRKQPLIVVDRDGFTSTLTPGMIRRY